MKYKSGIKLYQIKLIGIYFKFNKLSLDSNLIQGFVAAPVRCIFELKSKDVAYMKDNSNQQENIKLDNSSRTPARA